jgi:hypothetical protein
LVKRALKAGLAITLCCSPNSAISATSTMIDSASGLPFTASFTVVGNTAKSARKAISHRKVAKKMRYATRA